MRYVLRSCPYPALVEFNTRHARNLLTLAERSLEAALAPGGDDSSNTGSSSTGSGGVPGAAGGQAAHIEMAAQLFCCVTQCLDGGRQGEVSAEGPSICEAKGGLLVWEPGWGQKYQLAHLPLLKMGLRAMVIDRWQPHGCCHCQRACCTPVLLLCTAPATLRELVFLLYACWLCSTMLFGVIIASAA
jgi:hypothetical protein